jgi:hypothetical protein
MKFEKRCISATDDGWWTVDVAIAVLGEDRPHVTVMACCRPATVRCFHACAQNSFCESVVVGRDDGSALVGLRQQSDGPVVAFNVTKGQTLDAIEFEFIADTFRVLAR